MLPPLCLGHVDGGSQSFATVVQEPAPPPLALTFFVAPTLCRERLSPFQNAPREGYSFAPAGNRHCRLSPAVQLVTAVIGRFAPVFANRFSRNFFPPVKTE